MQIKSSAFEDSQKIPQRFTGEGEDISPPLEWSKIPAECKSFALLCEDPDAPKSPDKDHPFVHWLIYNISPNVSAPPEGILPIPSLNAPPMNADQGKNSLHRFGYTGPMPPVGHGIHHYIFTLFALNAELGLKPGLTKAEFLEFITGHILKKTQLIGKYERSEAKKNPEAIL